MDMKWRCRNDHILGVIRRNGNGVAQLMLLRHAIDMDSENPEIVDVIGPLMGNVPVRCEICDDVKIWDVGLNTLAELIRQLSREEKEQLQALLLIGHVKKINKKKNRARMG